MKKVKRAICLMAVFAVCLSLCGCNMLDELRASRAVYTDNGNLLFGDGTEFAPLPECEELNPYFNDYKVIYIVEEDLPLLLTTFQDNYYEMSDDGLFVYVFTDENGGYYCRTDVYDSVLERIENGFAPEICVYHCYEYDTHKDITYTLTQEQMDAIDRVLTTQESYAVRPETTLKMDYCVYLYMCSADMLFAKETVSISVFQDKYCIIDNTGEDRIVYNVPEEWNDTFAEIMELQIQIESAYPYEIYE